jgi:hypothetical protein
MATLTLTDTYNGKVLYDKQYVGYIEFDKTTQRYDVTSIRGREYGKSFEEVTAYFLSYDWRNIAGGAAGKAAERRHRQRQQAITTSNEQRDTKGLTL